MDDNNQCSGGVGSSDSLSPDNDFDCSIGAGIPGPESDNTEVELGHETGVKMDAPHQNPPPYTPGAPDLPPFMVGVGPVTNQPRYGAGLIPVVVGQQMGKKPTTLVCKTCQRQVVTTVEMKTSMVTHFFALMLCMTVVCSPCIIALYCTDTCKNTEHYCPECNALIGTHHLH